MDQSDRIFKTKSKLGCSADEARHIIAKEDLTKILDEAETMDELKKIIKLLIKYGIDYKPN